MKKYGEPFDTLRKRRSESTDKIERDYIQSILSNVLRHPDLFVWERFEEQLTNLRAANKIHKLRPPYRLVASQRSLYQTEMYSLYLQHQKELKIIKHEYNRLKHALKLKYYPPKES